MNLKQIERHVPILGWIHIANSFLMIVIAIFVFVLLTGIGVAVAAEDPTAPGVLAVVGMATGIFLLALSLPGLATGYGLLKRRPWARWLAIIVGAFNLFNIPIGTAIGLYTMYVLFQSEAETYFSSLKLA